LFKNSSVPYQQIEKVHADWIYGGRWIAHEVYIDTLDGKQFDCGSRLLTGRVIRAIIARIPSKSPSSPTVQSNESTPPTTAPTTLS
jgi:hypothetical protein